jgi:chromosome segregation ATPase
MPDADETKMVAEYWQTRALKAEEDVSHLTSQLATAQRELTEARETITKAAVTIDQLSKDRLRAERERDEAIKQRDALQANLRLTIEGEKRYIAERDALAAQNAVMREALERMVNRDTYENIPACTGATQAAMLLSMAHDALRATPPTQAEQAWSAIIDAAKQARTALDPMAKVTAADLIAAHEALDKALKEGDR